MADYSKTATSALRSIAKAGVSLPIYRRVQTVSEETGEAVESPTTQGAITAVVFPMSTSSGLKLGDKFTEALISGKMRKLLVAAKDVPFVPQMLDIVRIGTEYFEVVGNTPLIPDGTTPILYTLAVTRCGDFTPVESP